MPEAADPLDQLRGIHLPAEVGFWPLSPAAWVLVALLAALLIFIAIKTVRYINRLRAQKKRQQWAQQQLANIRAQAAAQPREACAALNTLLKRAALGGIGSESAARVAGLQGENWIAWLSRHGGKSLEKHAEWLIEGPYKELRKSPPAGLFDAASEFISKHWVAPQHLQRTSKRVNEHA